MSLFVFYIILILCEIRVGKYLYSLLFEKKWKLFVIVLKEVYYYIFIILLW